MAATIDSHGEIEIICETDDLRANRMAKLTFRAHLDAVPPYQIRVKSPTGHTILERDVRELPPGSPQSPPPISFTVQKGAYEISISQLKGGAEGHATLSVSE